MKGFNADGRRLRRQKREPRRATQVRKLRTMCATNRLRPKTRYWSHHRYRSEEPAGEECFEKAVRPRAPTWAQRERAKLTPLAG